MVEYFPCSQLGYGVLDFACCIRGRWERFEVVNVADFTPEFSLLQIEFDACCNYGPTPPVSCNNNGGNCSDLIYDAPFCVCPPCFTGQFCESRKLLSSTPMVLYWLNYSTMVDMNKR